ncbi:hypothetical protein [Veillonella seminalis]|uniref:Calcineurin-like phosphoesterase domain-containing protein n=1 Tax=Veillonella seminalis ACS-216-V-Col6b TaxID=883156 RepID=K9DMY3_9FIRM|nr:hypothetical protein [Veillonella seminalis]EKU78740.1 hypothetical protein HMPREF9282_00537 [Veillonella seminalis ACS-216-V-Col6b]
MIESIKALEDAYLPHIIECRVNAPYASLAVLSDIHQGLNNRSYLQRNIENLLKLGENCKVIIGGDSTNTTTKHSKGDVLEEWAVGDNQILALADDIKPLYETGQLIGILSGNHGDRAYNDAYISPEMMVASLLGDRDIYKGGFGIVYFNVNKNCYVHHILHKNKKARNYYDYFNADCTWFEHYHEPSAVPKIAIEHNKYVKRPTVKQVWELRQSSFQVFPQYAKNSGFRPRLAGYWIAEMTGDDKNKKVTPFMNDTYFDIKGV